MTETSFHVNPMDHSSAQCALRPPSAKRYVCVGEQGAHAGIDDMACLVQMLSVVAQFAPCEIPPL